MDKETNEPQGETLYGGMVKEVYEYSAAERDDTRSPDQDYNSDKSGSEHSGNDDDSDDASVVLEREEGDGQESTPNRKVDDDEDKRNPQYIPKRGTFYEHDDRTAVDENSEEVQNVEKEQEDKEAAKKKVWLDKEASKWSHDKFNEQDQAPKSKLELIDIYGYDIRNEEGPPRARRRRRYGRGPNKYTRNWEDEDAYGKPTNIVVKPSTRKSRPKTKDDEFPPLGGRNQSSDRDPDESLPDDEPSNDGGNEERASPRYEPQEEDHYERDHAPNKVEYEQENSEQKKCPVPQMPPKKMDKPKYRPEETSNIRGVTKTRGFKSGGRNRPLRNIQNEPEEPASDFILSQNFTNKSINIQELDKEVSKMSIQDANYNSNTRNNSKFNNNTGGSRQSSVPPRLQGEPRGSKRYSSLRQRSLTETPAPTFNQHTAYYQSEFGQPTPPAPNQAGLLPHPNPSIHSQVSAANTQLMTVAPTNPPIGALPPMNPPAPPSAIIQAMQFAQAYPQPPPGVAPPTFIPQQPPPPQMINYAQPPQFQQPSSFTNYQHQPFPPVNQVPAQPAELYQPQGGITYYSTQNQQLTPRIPQKRPTAAIPIVPPPEHKGRGRLNSQCEESPVGIDAGSNIQPDESVYADQEYNGTYPSQHSGDTSDSTLFLRNQYTVQHFMKYKVSHM